VAVVVLQEGLIIDLDSEFFQSDEYTKLVEQVKENTAIFLIKVGKQGFIHKSRSHDHCRVDILVD